MVLIKPSKIKRAKNGLNKNGLNKNNLINGLNKRFSI